MPSQLKKMPNPKPEPSPEHHGAAIRDIKAGKVEFRLDKTGIIHPRSSAKRRSTSELHLFENVATLLDAIVRAKPSAAKGTYLRSVTLPRARWDPASRSIRTGLRRQLLKLLEGHRRAGDRAPQVVDAASH